MRGKAMELVVLGSAGWVPQATRMTTSLAVRVGATLLLFDAGTGLARLREPRFGSLVPRDGAVHLFLSHLHLDHAVGLTFLPALWTAPTTIYVPAGNGATGDEGPSGREALDRLVSPPFFPHGLSSFPMPLTVVPLRPGSVTVAGLDGRTVQVRVRRQPHPGGSLGFRIDDAVAFLTDTAVSADAATFAAGVAVLVHEAWTEGDEGDAGPRVDSPAHSSAVGAARVAREAGVGELLLSHLSPLLDEVRYAAMLARARTVFPDTHLCEDGLRRIIR